MRIEHNRVDFTIHGSECFPVILEFAVDIPGQNAIRQYFHILGAFSPRINFFPALNSPDHLSHRPFIFTLRSDHVRSSFGPVYHGWQRADKRSRGYPAREKAQPRQGRGQGRGGVPWDGTGHHFLEPRLDAPWDGIFSPGSARGSNSSAASKEIQQEDRQIAARSSGNGAELSHKHIGQSKDHIG